MIYSKIDFSIAGYIFQYRFGCPVEIESDWPICNFFIHSDKVDSTNIIRFNSDYDYSWALIDKPILTTPSYSVYLHEDMPTIVFTPGTALPVAVLTMQDQFRHISTEIIDDSYTKQPIPLCVGGFVTQGVLATNNSGFIMHGAAWKDPESNSGFIFTGNSGVGKSTISSILRQNTNYRQISDDRVIVRKNKNDYYAYGNPFDFKIERVANDYSKINQLFFLHHSKDNRIIKLSKNEIVKRLFTIIILPYWERSLLYDSAKLLFDFSRQVQVYDLFFKPDVDVVTLVQKVVHS